MRIIAGELRGRRRKSPKGNDIRPTTDKVKEAVFSMLYPYMTPDFVAVDLFTGSGSMGLEAISRGAKTVYFCDHSRESLKLAKENILYCGVDNRAVLLAGEFADDIKRIKQAADIYFLDPPYAEGYILPALQAIDACGNIKPGGVVVCEHAKRDELPDEYCGFTKIRDRVYGAIGVTIYQREE